MRLVKLASTQLLTLAGFSEQRMFCSSHWLALGINTLFAVDFLCNRRLGPEVVGELLGESCCLFADTKTGEYFSQQFVAADSAGNFTQMILALPQVFGEQLASTVA